MTTGFPLTVPKPQFFDQNGDPLSAGTLEIYLAGTSTPANLYSDVALTVAAGTSIALNSRGEPPTRLFGDYSIAYKLVLKDSGGATVYTFDDYQWRPEFYVPRTAAEIAAGVTPTNYSYAAGDIRRYGGACDGTTSDYSAWVSAAAVGGEIIVPADCVSAIASASLGSTGIGLLSETVVRGASPDSSAIVVTGGAACNLFRPINQRAITLRDLRLRQNGVNTAAALGEFLYYDQTSAATAVGGRLRIHNCRFENCKGDNWIGIYNASNTYELRDVWITDNEFVSESGNARGPTSSGISSACITLGDSASASTQLIRDVHITGNTFNGEHIKTAVECWHNTSRVKIHGNICNAFSSDAAFSADDVGRYALLVYKGAPGTAIAPDLIDITGNTINGAKDAGMYVQSPNRVTIAGNTVIGQTGTADGTLPKGAVATNSGVNARIHVTGNTFVNCARGVQAVLSAGQILTVADNDWLDQPNSAAAVKITAAAGATTGEAYLDGVRISGGGTGTTGVSVDTGATFGLKTFQLRNFDIQATDASLRFTRSDATTPALDYIAVTDGAVRGGSSYGIQFENYSDTGQRAVFAEITFDGGFGASAYALSLDNSTGIEAHGLTFRDITGASQYAVSSQGAAGSIDGVRWQNVAAAQRVRNSGGTDLGRSTPTHSAAQGTFIQNLATADHDGNNMTLVGWRNYNGTTGWRTQYMSSVTPAT